MSALLKERAKLAKADILLDRAADMLFAASGALADREMPRLASALSDLAIQIIEREAP